MIVMEFVKGGCLQRYLKKNPGKTILQDRVEKMIIGSALGIEYLHSKKLIHRDIAARNCLWDKETCRISDFGLARVGDAYKLTVSRKVAFKHMSPEIFTTFRYTPKSDVYAFGTLVWEIMTDGKEPYMDKKLGEVKRLVVNEGKRLDFNADTPEEIKKIVVNHCWTANPDERASMKEVVGKLEEYSKRFEKKTPDIMPPTSMLDDDLIEPGHPVPMAARPSMPMSENDRDDVREILTAFTFVFRRRVYVEVLCSCPAFLLSAATRLLEARTVRAVRSAPL